MKDYDDDFDLESAPEASLGRPTPSLRPTAYLDGLRGLAALLVYFSHNIPWWCGLDGPLEHGFGYHGEHMFATFPFIRSFYTGGAAGVAIFFVMSGYVLSVTPLQMLKEGKKSETRRYLLSAAIRRPFRLYLPVAAISLIFALWMQMPFGISPRLAWPEPEKSLLAELVRWTKEMGWTINIFVPHGQFTHWFMYDPPAWTMAAELKGSFAVFILLALSVHFSHMLRLAAFAGVGVVFHVFYQWELACFMFGTSIAIVNLNGDTFRSRLPPRTETIVNYALFILGWWILCQPHGKKEPELSYGTPGWYYTTTLLTPRNYYDGEFWRWWNVIGAVLLIDGLSSIERIQSFFLRPTLQFLGKISFCLYLIHIPIAWTIGDRVARVLGVQRQDFKMPYDNMLKIPDVGLTGLSSGLIVWQMVVLPLNLFLAYQATQRIDGPSVKFGKWLVKKLNLTK